jgi:hypothetical protein
MFPFSCSLSDVMRAQRMASVGIEIPPGMVSSTAQAFVLGSTVSSWLQIRERSFLDNPEVPDEIKVHLLCCKVEPCVHFLYQ